MIRVEQLYKSFGPKPVLQGVNLEILDGETLTVIGGSGCGKSVLIKHLVGLLRPERGQIMVDGVDITRLTEQELTKVQGRFGYLFQGGALFDSLTVGENVAFGIRHLKPMPQFLLERRVSETLAMVGLSGVEPLKPAALSGGMRKRVGLARAIAYAPRYILYDEPTTGLDPIMADVINELILDLQRRLKTTAIVVTHDMKSAYKVSNRLAMLYEGRIIQVGSPEEIQHTTNPVVRQFITGSSVGPIKVPMAGPMSGKSQ
ncbi:MAG: ABC transporter ATP-binding protein [Elusimicrobia bacterium]|nr:ABC transporter ATP-binding protein [Elusimicrobiota bacterium]